MQTSGPTPCAILRNPPILPPPGNSGYDPAAWPPAGLAPLFGWRYSAEVAVVVGAAAVVRLGHALLFE
jgi:hypothetical protein